MYYTELRERILHLPIMGTAAIYNGEDVPFDPISGLLIDADNGAYILYTDNTDAVAYDASAPRYLLDTLQDMNDWVSKFEKLHGILPVVLLSAGEIYDLKFAYTDMSGNMACLLLSVGKRHHF